MAVAASQSVWNSAPTNRSKISRSTAPWAVPQWARRWTLGADGGDERIPVVMSPLMIAVGAIGISQRLPPGHHHREVGELQAHRMVDQERFGVGELGGAPAVGVDLGDHPHLIHPDLTGSEPGPDQFQVA